MAKQALELLTQCLLLLIAIYGISCSSGEGEEGEKGIEIFKVEFEHVQTPFIVCVWVLFASLAKIGMYSEACLEQRQTYMMVFLESLIGVFFFEKNLRHRCLRKYQFLYKTFTNEDFSLANLEYGRELQDKVSDIFRTQLDT